MKLINTWVLQEFLKFLCVRFTPSMEAFLAVRANFLIYIKKKKVRFYSFLPRRKFRTNTAARAPNPITKPRIKPRTNGSRGTLTAGD